MVKFEKKLLFSQILDGAFALTRMYIALPLSLDHICLLLQVNAIDAQLGQA
jgi:hypothetical protein